MLKELLKTLIKKPINNNFNATKAFSISKYGKEITGAQIYEMWLKEIKEEIEYKCLERSYSCVLNIPKDKEKYLEGIILTLKDNGFETNIISNNTLKDYKGQLKFLLITWDNISL